MVRILCLRQKIAGYTTLYGREAAGNDWQIMSKELSRNNFDISTDATRGLLPEKLEPLVLLRAAALTEIS